MLIQFREPCKGLLQGLLLQIVAKIVRLPIQITFVVYKIINAKATNHQSKGGLSRIAFDK